MPLNSEGIEVDNTSNEEIEYLMEEFIGYIKTVFGRCLVTLNNRETELFNCTITNGTQNVTLLIWDDEKINKLSGELVAGRIIHLDGCEGQVVTKKRYHDVNNLLNYEIIIQPGSVVEFHGSHLHCQRKEVLIPTVEFLNIAKVVGEINGPLGFGSGSITDDTHKLPVRVTTFKAEDSAQHAKGLCAMITGTVSHTDPLTVICKNIDSLELLEGEKPLDKAVISKANKPLKKCASSGRHDYVEKTKRVALKETNL